MSVGKKSIILLALLVLAGRNRGPSAAPNKHLQTSRNHLTAPRYDEPTIEFRNAPRLCAGYVPTRMGLAIHAHYYLSPRRDAHAENAFKEINRESDSAGTRLGQSGLDIQQGSAGKAIDNLLDLLRQNPNNTQAQLRIDELCTSLRGLAKAEETARSVLAASINDAAAHYLLGRILSSRNDVDKALAELDAALRLQESLVPAHLEKARLLLSRGDLEGAQKALDAALQYGRDNMLVRGTLAKALALRRKPNEALQQAEIVLAAMPGNVDAITARGDALQSLGSLNEAMKEYLKLCDLQPGNAASWNRLGINEASRGDSASALSHFRKAAELQPDFLGAITNILALLLKDKKFEEALSELDGLSKRGSPQDEIHRLRGQVYLAKGDGAAGERELRKAIEVNPQNYQSYLMLGQMYAQRRDFAQALKEVDQLIAKNDKIAPAYLLKASCLEASNDPAGAVANYRRVLQLDPENAYAANNLAWRLCESGTGLDEALALAQKARRNSPDNPEIADTLGWIYYRMKNYTLAVDHLSFSVKKRQSPGAVHYYRLGMAYYGKGDLRQAQQNLEKSLELDPNLPGAGEVRKILRAPQ